MSAYVKVMTNIENEVGAPPSMRGIGVMVTTSQAGEGHWRQRAEEAADALFKLSPLSSTGWAIERVCFQFDVETFQPSLVDAARDAFLGRWRALQDGSVAPPT